MKTFFTMTGRNIKLFMKDKGMFFASLITPAILLVLYVTFLANVYRDSMPEGLPEKLVNGMVAGEVMSSMLAVICVTVAFCSNLVMVQDKISGAQKDFSITPVRKSTLAVSYFVATFAVTMLITLVAMVLCLIYVGASGWYMSAGDVFLLLLDVILLTLFGTVLSSLVNCFVNTQGQASAVGTIVSAGYGFFCGAYMPIDSMGKGMQGFMGLLPGTYGTSLVRNHSLNGALRELANIGAPQEVIDKIRDSVDCNLYFFGTKVSITACYLVIVLTILVALGLYILLSYLIAKNKIRFKEPKLKNRRLRLR